MTTEVSQNERPIARDRPPSASPQVPLGDARERRQTAMRRRENIRTELPIRSAPAAREEVRTRVLSYVRFIPVSGPDATTFEPVVLVARPADLSPRPVESRTRSAPLSGVLPIRVALPCGHPDEARQTHVRDSHPSNS